MINEIEKTILEKYNYLEILLSLKNKIKSWGITKKNELIITFLKSLTNEILINILREFKNEFEIIEKNKIKFTPAKSTKQLKVNQVFKIKNN